MSKEDIRETVTNDCRDFWSRATITKFMPDEYKDPQKQEAGRKRQEKQRLEEPIPAGTVPAESSSDSSTGQESESFENMDRGPDVKPTSEMYRKLQRDLKNRLEATEQVVKEKDKEIEKWKNIVEGQNIPDIPQLVDNKIGVVKIQTLQNLSKLSEFDRRGYQILASRFGEIVRRKIVGEGKATVRFYIIGKDRTTNVEYMVPIAFTVDMICR